ncbi:MAG: T9SS type A sorting domain-containing protein [bacterium]
MAVLIAVLSGGTSSFANTAPVIATLTDQTILEGETLTISVRALDADGDNIDLGIISCPAGGAFETVSNGLASFQWTPDFTGPNSSENSPFVITVWAGDGASATTRQMKINVLNNNRPPVLNSPTALVSTAGDRVQFEISYIDPDNDPVQWTPVAIPDGNAFIPGQPALFDWQTLLRDSGDYDILIAVSDQYGASDTADISLNLAPALVYALKVDTVRGYPGELVTVDINLLNLEPVSGFDLLVNYDVSSMTVSSITKVGTRAASFEYFSYSLNYRTMMGDIRIVGTADLASGAVTLDLPAGNGPVARLSFYLTSDQNYGGFAVPVNFVFRDQIDQSDNVLFDTGGVRVEQTAIVYENGYVLIQKPDLSNLGDINLNGIPYEIGDAVVLTNYFINPRVYPLNSVQRAYSDVNQDGIMASVSDLVYLVNKIVNLFGNSGKLRYDGAGAEIAAISQDGGLDLIYRSSEELGAVLITFSGAPESGERLTLSSPLSESGLDFKWAQDGATVRSLIFSETGKRLPAGLNTLLRVEGEGNLKIQAVELSSTEGLAMPATVKDNFEFLPQGYALYQNHPNPFNPLTAITFDIPKAALVDLKIYNLLGQEICQLVDGFLPAGRHQVIWDGRNRDGSVMASGIYFYTITADRFNDRKKMILLK